MRSIDRWRGSLLGLACGDALGMPVEFADPPPSEPVIDMMSGRSRWQKTPAGEPVEAPAGSWTDDTAMTLCLAESLLECSGVNLPDQMQRYWCWGNGGHLSATGQAYGMGPTVKDALRRFSAGQEPWGDAEALTNGSLMRAAAPPLFFAGHPDLVRSAAECSTPTHLHPVCQAACQIFANLLAMALAGAGRPQLLSTGAGSEGLAGPLPGRLDQILSGDLAARPRDEISGANNVECTLEAALWSFATTSDFESGAIVAVDLGLDADTTACVYGALAGAHYGIAQIPGRWLDRLCRAELLEQFSDRLHAAANG